MKLVLIDDWHRSWRWASVHLALVVGLIPTFLAADPEDAVATVQALAGAVHSHPWLAAPLGIIAAGIPWAARIITLRRGWHGPHQGEQP